MDTLGLPEGTVLLGDASGRLEGTAELRIHDSKLNEWDPEKPLVELHDNCSIVGITVIGNRETDAGGNTVNRGSGVSFLGGRDRELAAFRNSVVDCGFKNLRTAFVLRPELVTPVPPRPNPPAIMGPNTIRDCTITFCSRVFNWTSNVGKFFNLEVIDCDSYGEVGGAENAFVGCHFESQGKQPELTVRRGTVSFYGCYFEQNMVDLTMREETTASFVGCHFEGVSGGGQRGTIRLAKKSRVFVGGCNLNSLHFGGFYLLPGSGEQDWTSDIVVSHASNHDGSTQGGPSPRLFFHEATNQRFGNAPGNITFLELSDRPFKADEAHAR